ncbi:MAG: Asp-tRNA(Asn)/Glu-tRNA(Gln) amidotransferase subunit GatC [Bacteroidota bacterium]
MSVSVEDVKYIAALARLSFSEDEQARLAGEMNAILSYMAKLDELNTDDIPPMTHVLDVNNVFRAEDVEQRISHDEALKNAPDADSDYFRVPKVIS